MNFHLKKYFVEREAYKKFQDMSVLNAEDES